MKKINEESLSAIAASAKVRLSMPSMIRHSQDVMLLENMIRNMEASDVPQRGTFYAQTAFTAIYSKVTAEIKQLYRDLDTIKNFYITKVIIDQVVDDTLSPTVGSDDVFKYSHKNPEIQKRLDKLTDKLALNKLVQNIAADLCFYGHYPLTVKLDYPKQVAADKSINNKAFTPKPTGIKELKDDLEFGSVVKVDLGANEYAFLHQQEETGILKYHQSYDFIYFSLGGARIKARTDLWAPVLTNIQDEKVKEYLEKIPKYVRVGKPYFYQMTDKLRELELLEKLVPAVKINKLTQGNLMSVRLPETFDLTAGVTVANKFEQLVNRKVSVDPVTGQITVEAILQSAGRTRIIPQFGEKGTIDKFDTKADAVDDIQSQATELKNSILDSMGIPSELIYKADNAAKNDTIKRYAKYLRKLKQLQKALSDGLKQIAYIDLLAAGHNDIKMEEIEVNFLNALIEVDMLDKLEFTVSTVNTVKEVTDFFVNNLAGEGSPFKDMVDLNKVAEWIDGRLKFVGLSDVIKTQKEGGKLVVPPPPVTTDGADDGQGTPSTTTPEASRDPLDDETDEPADNANAEPDEDIKAINLDDEEDDDADIKKIID